MTASNLSSEASEIAELREQLGLIDRREAIKRVTVLLGGIALVGGSSLLTSCQGEAPDEPFTSDDVAFLDEIAETILPETSTPGAKAAKTGAFIALMATDSYDRRDRGILREGMRKIDETTRKAYNVPFMSATPEQRLAVLRAYDREQRTHSIARENASRQKRGLAALPPEARPAEEHLPDQRRELSLGSDVGAATAITADDPAHFFRMMKELALLGYFTSEIGATQAQRYIESPGRYDPCVPYKAGEKGWAPHA
jgi:hypothetical protein